MAELKPGRLTDLVLEKERYLPEIEHQTLYATCFAGGLLLFRKRKGFWRMQYLLEPDCALPDLPEGVIVAEQAFRPEDAPALPEVFAAAGFEPALTRVRLTREAGESAPADLPDAAHQADISAIGDLLARSFDPYTGCLPTRAELTDAVTGGRVYCIRFPDGSPMGVLHTEQGRASLEIRHLAVDERVRGQGTASRLLAGLLAREGQKKLTVFTGAANAAALGLYQKYGFVPDGTSSLAFWKGAGQNGRTDRTALGDLSEH